MTMGVTTILNPANSKRLTKVFAGGDNGQLGSARENNFGLGHWLIACLLTMRGGELQNSKDQSLETSYKNK